VTTLEKIQALGNAGSYDLCSGSECKTNMHKPLHNSIYPAVTGTGKCLNLFKTLQTNACTHDCKYCVNNNGRCHKREKYTPEELSHTFMNLVRLRKVQGLFLSSGVGGDPDKIMSEMIRSVELIRHRYHFKGYVHLKVLPGTNRYLVHRACEIAHRVSINLETTPDHLPELSLDKDFKSDLIKRLGWVRSEEKRGLLPDGVTTQLIVGGAGETDQEVLSLVSGLYKRYDLRRVYFSTFSPVKGTPLENGLRINPLRGHRLYQSDFLLRQYGFKLSDLKLDDGFINLLVDPKVSAAMNDDRLPLDVNEASSHDLLRVPGIGPKTVNKVLSLRPFNSLKDLRKAGVITKRAAPFIIINGHRQSSLNDFLPN